MIKWRSYNYVICTIHLKTIQQLFKGDDCNYADIQSITFS
jgi:hypothetical protein